jgi:hypothetical protein
VAGWEIAQTSIVMRRVAGDEMVTVFDRLGEARIRVGGA